MANENNTPNPEDEYIGNMWGWKFSWISLGLILFTMGVVYLRGDEAFEDAKKENLLEITTPYHQKKPSSSDSIKLIREKGR